MILNICVEGVWSLARCSGTASSQGSVEVAGETGVGWN